MQHKNVIRTVRIFIFSTLSIYTATIYSFNMSYVEVNYNRLENVGCYLRADNQQPFFRMASLFAANINGSDPNEPIIFFNEQAEKVLKSQQVKNLQKKGIKVLITLLGNHQNAGWSCLTSATAAKKFADDIVTMVNQYQFDGVDIDDEYSNCLSNDYSMIMLAQAIKSHPGFKGKVLTKALFADWQYFKADYKGHHLAEYLDYGWEMSYGSGRLDDRLSLYLESGMTANQLMIGGWTAYTYPDPYEIGQHAVQKSLAGTMVYDVTKSSLEYLSQILAGQENIKVKVMPNCLN